ncbi:MAG: hypothetical protein KBB83_04615 [Alphaproteobacteria bacterium]|nr:hypothetical protein [Alphaproteobacteria bacterium]
MFNLAKNFSLSISLLTLFFGPCDAYGSGFFSDNVPGGEREGKRSKVSVSQARTSSKKKAKTEEKAPPEVLWSPHFLIDKNFRYLRLEIVRWLDGESAKHFALVSRQANALVWQREHVSFVPHQDLLTDAWMGMLHHGLKTLDLAGCAIEEADVRVLAPVLGNLTKLESLDLSHNQIGPLGLNHLARVLSNSSCLTHLFLSHNKLGEDEDRKLVSLKVLTNLESLDLSYNDMNDDDVESLALLLEGLENLTSLDLSDFPYRPHGLNHVIKENLVLALGKHKNLKELKLSNLHICENGIQGFSLLLENLTGLEFLALRDNSIGLNNVGGLVPVFARLIHLKYLNLCNNCLGFVGGRILLSGLENLNHLTHLNLNFNDLGDRGAVILSGVLRILTSLMHLSLKGNVIDVPGAKSLAPALEKLLRLKHLDLSHNSIGDSGFACILEATSFFHNAPDAILKVWGNDLSENVMGMPHPAYIFLKKPVESVPHED